MSKLENLLRFDPLAEAEKIVGHSYKDKEHGDGFDNPVNVVGLLLAHEHAVAKETLLREMNDTVFSNEVPRYRQIVEKYGFEEVLCDPWISSWGPAETYYIFAHRNGLLLHFDTFNSKSVNAARVLYNWKPAIDNTWTATSSGHMHASGVWVGDHDAREALIHKLNTLNNRGEFVSPWIERPFLWLLNFDEPKVAGYDSKAITEARVKRLPDWVQSFIGPE